jgi:hypothetical protein
VEPAPGVSEFLNRTGLHGGGIMRKGVAVTITASLLAGCATGAPGAREWTAACPPPNFATESLDRWFRLGWSLAQGRSGPQLEGYVDNQWKQGADKMRLVVERLDASGRVVGCSEVWVGMVPAYSRTFFLAAVPDANAQYRVRVLSFDWQKIGAAPDRRRGKRVAHRQGLRRLRQRVLHLRSGAVDLRS